MKIKEYINPAYIVKSLRNALTELTYYKNYKKIIQELDENGYLQKMKISRENDYLLIGVDLNPELLIYEENTIESAELRVISEKLKKYTVFLQKEGILDSVKADYERIKNDNYYGYLISISFKFKKYDSFKFKYDIAYLFGLFFTLSTLIYLLFNIF